MAEFTRIQMRSDVGKLAATLRDAVVDRFIVTSGLLVVTLVGAACAPSLNWRRVVVAEEGYSAWMPCRPSSVERQVEAAEGGGRMRVQMKSCEAGGMVWAVSISESVSREQVHGDPQRWLQAIAGAFTPEASRSTSAWRTTHWPSGVAGTQLSIEGMRLDGTRRQAVAGVVVFGDRMLQVIVMGDEVSREQVLPFFEGIEPPRPAPLQVGSPERKEAGG